MTGATADFEALFIAVDVHYLDGGMARAAAVAAGERTFSRIAWTRAVVVPAGTPYVPGELYLRELYVTAAGMTVAEAGAVVREMAGRFRLPDALKLADRLARGLETPGA